MSSLKLVYFPISTEILGPSVRDGESEAHDSAVDLQNKILYHIYRTLQLVDRVSSNPKYQE